MGQTNICLNSFVKFKKNLWIQYVTVIFLEFTQKHLHLLFKLILYTIYYNGKIDHFLNLPQFILNFPIHYLLLPFIEFELLKVHYYLYH